MGLKRDIDAGTLAAISAPVFWPVFFAHVDWPGREQRAHSGTGVLSWGGHDWQGVGSFGAFLLQEGGSGFAQRRATLRVAVLGDEAEAYLSDVPADVRGSAVSVYMGALSAPMDAGGVLAGDPFLIYAGRVDSVSYRHEPVSDGVRRVSMKLGLVDGIAPRRRAEVTHSAADSLAADPTDTAGEHLVGALTRVVRWPS